MGKTLLWILAGASLVLLSYEAWTLIGSVLQPLIVNRNTLQTDFHYYYVAAQRFSQDRALLYLTADDVIAGFAYPPPAIVPFVALSQLPLGVALLILTVCSYLMIGFAASLWIRHLRARGWTIDGATVVAIILIVFALGPTYMNAIFGQVNAFILASAVAFVHLAPVAALAAGAVLAIGAWLKIYPAYVAAIGLWDRATWRAIGWAIAAGIAIPVVLLPIVPWRSYVDFIAVLDARVDKTAIHITNQSLVAFIERFRFPADLFLNWTGQQAITVSRVVQGINSVAIGVGALVIWKRPISLELKAASLIATVSLIAPLGWGHTYVMVLPLVILQLIAMRTASKPMAIVIFLCITALMIPAGRHLPIDRAPDWFENLVYSRYLLATLILMSISSAHSIGQKTESAIIASA